MRTRHTLAVLALIAAGYLAVLGFLSPLSLLLRPEAQQPGSPATPATASARPAIRPPAGSLLPAEASPSTGVTTIDARLLVIAASEHDAALPAIRQVLDALGTPYTVWVAAQHPGGLVAGQLASGAHGLYQGVMLTSGKLNSTEEDEASDNSALSPSEWKTLWSYEVAFGIRQATWFTYPSAQYGFGSPTALNTAQPNSELVARLTPAGQKVFAYLAPDYQTMFHDTYVFLAAAASRDTTPLLVDAHGNALAAIHTYSDGRQNLAFTFENRADLLPTLELSYGIVNWVTRGLFLGERHVYLEPQVDDVFLPDDIWTAGRPCGAPDTNTGETYRITGDDLLAVIAWQQARQRDPNATQLRLELAFNGFGTTGVYSRDTLTSTARQYQDQFKWINHTLDHPNLDNVTYDVAKAAIEQNNRLAGTHYLKLKDFSPINLVTPEISGLTNVRFLQAAYDAGVRYLVSDASLPGYDNPSPNAGIYNRYQPEILMIPRHASTLAFNVSTPEQWAAAYACLPDVDDAPAPATGQSGRLTYRQILDRESDDLLRYLLRGDLDPIMFHQANLRAYDGSHMLLGDLLDLTLAKYGRRFTLPILSPSMDEIGRRMARRMQYDRAGVSAAIVPGRSITLSARQAAVVPVTGLCSSDAEVYGGQCISSIVLEAEQPVTIAFPAQGEAVEP